MHPATLLASLSAAAGLAGWWCWQSYEMRRPKDAATGVSTELPDPSSLTYSAAETTRTQARGMHARILELDKEAVALRREYAATLGAEVAPIDPSQQINPADAYPLPAVISSDEKVTTLDQDAQIRTATVKIENRMRELDAEVTRLKQQIHDAVEAKKPPPAPGDVAARVVSVRELTFRQIPEFVPASVEEIIECRTAAGSAGMDTAAAAARARAWVCMGFVPSTFDFVAASGSLAAQKIGGFYDSKANRFLFQSAATLARSDSRDAFAGALFPALLQQNFPSAVPPPPFTENDDAARALTALSAGDANFGRVLFSTADLNHRNFDRGQAPAASQASPNAPPFLYDVWKWMEAQGDVFVQSLYQQGGFKAVNAAYARPPKSTAEILHPELYTATPPFEPEKVDIGDLNVSGTAPLADNTAGELGAYYLVRMVADEDFATGASEGWAGDRWAVWPGAEPHGDHFLWRSVWRTPEDAKQFFDALRRLMMSRHKIPHQAEYDAVPNEFRVDDPHRIIRLRLVPETKTVTLINATDAAFAKALEAK